MTSDNNKFRIKLTVAVYKEKTLSYRNDMVVPTWYTRRSEARVHIKKEIKERLSHSSFFISPRVDFDLVRYTKEASCNTYLRYRIIDTSQATTDQDGILTSNVKDSQSIVPMDENIQ